MILKELFDRPVIILAAPRSGSTLLFETLAQASGLWTVGGESHQIIEGIKPLNPNYGQVDSNRLTEEHAHPQIMRALRQRFAQSLVDYQGQRLTQERLRPLRMLEKTPKNALRQPFLDRVFPDALYIYLYRDPRHNISSMMEAWRSPKWVTYPQLPGWQGLPWSLLLPPGWQSLSGKPLEEVCAYQWETSNRLILDDLHAIESSRWTAVGYQDLLDDTASTVQRLCDFMDIEMDASLKQRTEGPLPHSRFTHTPPDKEKWRKNETEIMRILDSVEATSQRAAEVVATA